MADPARERTEIVSQAHDRPLEAERSEATTTDEHVEAMVVDPHAGRRAAARKLTGAVYLLFGLLAVLVALRAILRLLGANPASPFAASLFALTSPLLAPFVGLFPRIQLPGGVFEPEALVAVVVYLLLAWLLARVVWLLLDDTHAETVHRATRRRTRLP